MKFFVRKISIAVVFTLLIGVVCVCPESASGTETDGDYVKILSVTPDYYENYTDAVTFTAVVEYNLASREQGIVYLGFNTEEAHWFSLKDEVQVPKGRGTVELSASVTPVNWGSPANMALQGAQMATNGYSNFVRDFILYANISEYPHEERWKPLATQEFVLHYGRTSNAGSGTGAAQGAQTPEKKEVFVFCGGTEYSYPNDLEYYLSKTSSTDYSPELAGMLMGLSYAAYDKREIKKTLESVLKIGEEQYGVFNYHDNPNDAAYGKDSVAFSIGRKKSESGDEIVLITVRGSYGNVEDWTKDWISNFNIGSAAMWYSWHGGFETAAREVYATLRGYAGIKSEGVRYVVTGHSRGAAVANLLAVMLSDDGVPKENVYGYNFACPDVAVANAWDWNRFSEHDNMFNIANATDPVSVVPGMLGNFTLGGFIGDWGKFGRSYWFSEDWNDLSKCQVVLTNFDSHGQDKYFSFMRKFMEQGIGISEFKSWVDVKLKCEELSLKENMSKFTGVVFSIFCPVDVEVLDDAGNTILVIKGNTVVEDSWDRDKVFVGIYEGDKKIVVIPEAEHYTVRMTATDTGKMQFGAGFVNLITYEKMDEVAYSDVNLEAGKVMEYSFLASEDAIEEPHLFVLDEKGGEAAEIDKDGNETLLGALGEPGGDADGQAGELADREDDAAWKILFLIVYFASVIAAAGATYAFCWHNSHKKSKL